MTSSAEQIRYNTFVGDDTARCVTSPVGGASFPSSSSAATKPTDYKQFQRGAAREREGAAAAVWETNSVGSDDSSRLVLLLQGWPRHARTVSRQQAEAVLAVLRGVREEGKGCLSDATHLPGTHEQWCWLRRRAASYPAPPNPHPHRGARPSPPRPSACTLRFLLMSVGMAVLKNQS